MAVVEIVRVAQAPWSLVQLADMVKAAFIDAGLMTDWYDSFVNDNREHRILEVIYDSSKTYGRTYYHFLFGTTSGSSNIYLFTTTGWDATTHYPRGAGTSVGSSGLDWVQNSGNFNVLIAHSLLAVNASISISITSYTSGGRAFFTLRTGTQFATFTIDPPGTTLRSFCNFDIGYHSGIYTINTSIRSISVNSIYRLRRDFLLGGSLNGMAFQSLDGAAYNQTVNRFALPNTNYSRTTPNFGDPGFVLPGWTTTSNPNASNFNPIFTGIRLTSIHTADLPSDFGITSIKNSNQLAIQDTATVTPGVEEYRILAFSNQGDLGAGVVLTSNPAFLARTV